MWKLLRNSLFVAVLLAGAFKLVLWYEIQQGAARLVAQLAPYAQVHYGGVSAGLKGEVEFSGVAVALGKEPSNELWRAANVEIGTPGPFWLARRLLLGDDSLPDHLTLVLKGLVAPAAAADGVGSWLSPISLVPLETLGCGIVSRFSIADYQRMGLNPGAQLQRIEYHFDAAAAALSVSMELRSPPFSTVSLHAELNRVDPRAFAGGGWDKLHVSELNVAYADDGYFAKRNRFCAQQAGIDQARFVDQHLAAVTAFLGAHGVEPGAEITALYRSLIVQGGRMSVLSLPSAGSPLGELLAEAPDAMLRRLNLTARRNDTPPVMFRLSFKAPDTGGPAARETAARPADVATASAPGAASSPVAASATPVAAALTSAAMPLRPPAMTSTAPTSTAPPLAAGAKTVPATAAATLPPASTAVSAKPSAVAAATTVKPPLSPPPAAGSIAVRPITAVPPAAGAPPPAGVAAANPPAKPAEKTVDAAGLGASAPPPPPGSTLALVWKPTLDRLEEPPPPPRDYDVVEYGALSAYPGRLVRLVTMSSKKVEGRIISVDEHAVSLRIRQSGGTAELQVPRSVIVEIQLPHLRGTDGKS